MSKDYAAAKRYNFVLGISYFPNLTPEDIEFRVLNDADFYDLIMTLVDINSSSIRESRQIEFLTIRFSNPASAGAGEAGDVSVES